MAQKTKKLLISIGIPASGKSELLKPFAIKNDFVYLCLDEIRENFFNISRDNPQAASNNITMIEVWDKMREMMVENIKNNENIIIDATFVNPKLRDNFLQIAKNTAREFNISLKIYGVFVDTSTETSLMRNRKRKTPTPDHVLEERIEMLKSTPPKLEEGFDCLITIQELEKIILIEKKRT